MKTIVRSILAAALLVATASSAQAQQCQQQLDACEWKLGQALDDLAAAERDSDGDRVRDVSDACPSTPPDVSVDSVGCSQEQFCSRQSATAPRDRRTCRRLDWLNDEPGQVAKRDCAALRDPSSGGFVCRATSGPDSDAACLSVETLLSFPPEDDAVAGVTLSLQYPPGVSIPGQLDDPKVFARVQNRTGISNGLFAVSDIEDPLSPPTLLVGLISLQQPIPAGSFALIGFDCEPGQPRPVASDFTCQVDTSDAYGNPVPTECRVVLR